MTHESTVARVRSALDEVARELERWCAAPAELLARRSRPDAWSGSEILEHVMLVNRYLLLTLEKQAARALRRARHVEVDDGDSDLARLQRIGQRKSFPWHRPDHMAPSGTLATAEARVELARQFALAHALLASLANGEGTLVRVRMSVDDLGPIDLYEWTYFLVQHARRHLAQLAELGSL